MAKKAKLDILEVNLDQPPPRPDLDEEREREAEVPETLPGPPAGSGLLARVKPWLAKPWVWIVAASLLLIPGIAAVVLWYGMEAEEPAQVSPALPPAAASMPQVKDKTFYLEGFAIDQRNAQGEIKIAFCDLAVELEDPDAGKGLGERSEVRDLIYTFLKAKKVEELLTLEQRNLLKEELKEALNQRFSELRVVRVYLTRYEVN